MNTKFRGTIVEAGTDDKGRVGLIIHTSEQELAALDWLPLFQEIEIELRKVEKSEENKWLKNAQS